jgi:hypothetical protein
VRNVFQLTHHHTQSLRSGGSDPELVWGRSGVFVRGFWVGFASGSGSRLWIRGASRIVLARRTWIHQGSLRRGSVHVVNHLLKV